VSVPVAQDVSYSDLARYPDDHLRRELIDGELYVTPTPALRHQRAVLAVAYALEAYAREHGGEVYPAPTDVVFDPQNVVEPDVVFLASEQAATTDDRFIDVVPDLVVEVSSPTTRRLDLIKKRGLYEARGVPEFWFVDLDADQVDVHRLGPDGRYGMPTSHGAGDDLTCLAAPGLRVPVGEALGRRPR